MSLNKIVVKDLKKRVKELSFLDLDINDVKRFLKNTYYSCIGNKHIEYSTYLEVTAYLILLRVLLQD